MGEDREPAFEELLEYVRDARGFDYTDYKRPSLVRRFRKRMQDVKVEDWESYRVYLERNPGEFAELFDTILINVTSFFRDPPAWEFLAEHVVPRIVESAGTDTIRVWSAGCASGEEAYSAAILFADALGEERFREQVKLYATDVDERALRDARHAAFPPRALESVPAELGERYFESTDSHVTLRPDLRRALIFGRNDLLRDPPISRVHLLICRNTLMYFGRSAQNKILANFSFALRNDGFLFLGRAEALQTREGLFVAENLRQRVFTKNPAQSGDPWRAHVASDPPRVGVADTVAQEIGFELAPVAQVVVDEHGAVVAVNYQARQLFGLTQRDVGRPLQDLELSYRPIELRSRIDEVRAEVRPVHVRDVAWPRGDGDARCLDIHLVPVVASGGALTGVSIAFADTTRYRALQDEVEQAQRELETAYEELQSTVEELETTNEELQSTNEELETTNEELQSTNEELETMNEELQSTNEELETMNDEMRERTDEAMRSNAFLSAVLESIHQSVVVVDADFRILRWSRGAADLWGLRADEVEGEHLLALDIGLPVSELRAPIRTALSSGETGRLEFTTHNRRGRRVRGTSVVDALRVPDGTIAGAIVVTSVGPA